MWFFDRKRKIGNEQLLGGATDYHSHLLPAIDDGVQNLPEALATLDTYETSGIKNLWLTPHVMEDFPNHPTRLKARFEEFMTSYHGGITLHLASEYMLDNYFFGLLEKNDLLPIGTTGNHLLVETSYYTPPRRLKESLKRIQSKGYHPLLAHPERYMYMEKEVYKELKEMGVKFQLNIISLAGVYGKATQKKAQWLLKNEMYDVAGSDMHDIDALYVINSVALNKKEMETVRTLLNTEI